MLHLVCGYRRAVIVVVAAAYYYVAHPAERGIPFVVCQNQGVAFAHNLSTVPYHTREPQAGDSRLHGHDNHPSYKYPNQRGSPYRAGERGGHSACRFYACESRIRHLGACGMVPCEERKG